MKNTKKRVFDIIQIGNKTDLISTLFDYVIVAIIIINLSVTFALTYEELSNYRSFFYVIESITIVIFTIEYILRLWTADYLYPEKSSVKAKITFVFSFFGLIDLFTFLPFYLPIFFPAGLVAFRIFRVIRIFRLFRVNAQYDAYNVIINVLKNKRNQLISSSAMIFIFMLSASLAMYSLEHNAQPTLYRNAFSGIWWSVSTLLTVGYGDIYPITTAGQILGILIAFLGVGMVAIPTGIISAGFVEEYNKANQMSHQTDNSSSGYSITKGANGEIILTDSEHIITISNK